MLTPHESQQLARLEALLDAHIAPLAEAIDQEPEAAARALAVLGEAGLLVLGRPERFGGPGFGLEAGLRAKALITRSSGALAFLQTQHESAAAGIVAGDNAALADVMLPAMGAGERLVGIGYSQLRRPGPPMLRARTLSDGAVELDGVVPWVTGLGYFGEVMVAGVREDGRVCFALVPLTVEAPGVHVGEPMRMAAMEVTRTVELRLEAHHVPASRVAREVEPGWIEDRDAQTLARKAFFVLGVGEAAVRELGRLGERRGDAAIRRAHDAMRAEHEALFERLVGLSVRSEPSPREGEARGAAIVFAARAAHAVVVATGGGANLMGSPAQRLYREALAFSVLGQNADVRTATLDVLVNNA